MKPSDRPTLSPADFVQASTEVSAEVVVILEQLVLASRKLLDTCQEAPATFAARFATRAQAVNLEAVADSQGRVHLISQVAFFDHDLALTVRLDTQHKGPQHWKVGFDGFALLSQEVSDRTRWVRQIHASEKPPANAPWTYTPGGRELLFKPGSPVTFGMFAQYLTKSLSTAQQLVKETADPGVAQDIAAEKAAVWGTAFVGAVPEPDTSHSQTQALLDKIGLGAKPSSMRRPPGPN